MNAALSAGHHLLITPGVYTLDQALNVANANTVVLGLSLATLAPANMIDARTDTRWSSGSAQAATGQWVTITMGSAQQIDLVSINCGGNDTDFAHGYQLFLSDDGVTWGTAIASAATGSQLETISFPAQTAQYIHVVQTETSGSWW
ncbi:MAG TPA: discoidin domain-containing protein [Actinocrinis sp.]|nr:discoidin domain-containing protein [Actinocrinis sp.]